MSGVQVPPTADASGITDYDPAVPASAVVVNWNGRAHLELCLGSLLQQSLAGIEVLLVDNGSTDGSLELVRQQFPTVGIVALAANLGYSEGANAGIRVARGRYVFLVNNDTEIERDCLRMLVATADAYPNAGTCAPKILAFANRAVIDNVGHLLYGDGLSRGRGRLEVDRGQYDHPEEILLPSGCALLLRRAMLADVGLFDDAFFAYCDDTDLGLRARLGGWTCRYVPSAIVYHKYSASSSEYSPLKAFLVERNRAWVAVKCLPAWWLLLSPLFTLARYGAQAWGAVGQRGAAGRFTASHSRRALAAILARAAVAAARGFPDMWRKRRRIQRARRVTTNDMLGWMRRYRMGVREVAFKD